MNIFKIASILHYVSASNHKSSSNIYKLAPNFEHIRKKKIEEKKN